MIQQKRKKLPVAAAILTGGSSSRMGKDKSLLRLDGQTLTALAAQKLLMAGYSPVMVVGPKKAYGLPSGFPILEEAFRGQGPLSGLEAALAATGLACLLMPCDMPSLTISLLRKLRLAHKPGSQATAFEFEGRLQTLPAIYSARLLTRVRRKLGAKRNALFPLLRGKATGRLSLPKGTLLENWNDPESITKHFETHSNSTKLS